MIVQLTNPLNEFVKSILFVQTTTQMAIGRVSQLKKKKNSRTISFNYCEEYGLIKRYPVS